MPSTVPTGRRRCGTRLLLLVLPLLILLQATPAWADLWYESYEKAERALRDGDWDEAIRQIQAALEKKGDSSARARTYGMNFKEYFPYYKLGVAYYNLGDFGSALQALDGEERAGAIQGSDQFAELQALRATIDQAAQAEAQQRIGAIVEDNLAEAQQLERQGSLEEALAAVERARAVAPEDSDVTTAWNRLREAIATRQEQEFQRRQQEDVGNRVTQLVQQGRDHLDAGRLQDAVSSFDQALTLRDDASTRRLLDDARGQLRRQLESEQDAERIRTTISQGLTRATELETAGDYAAALDELQAVLALDPSNRQALNLQQRLRSAQAGVEEESARQRTVEELLAQAENFYQSGDYEQAQTVANRAMALSPGNRDVWGFISRNQARLADSLLATEQANFPPQIAFIDRRGQPPEGDVPEIQRVPSGFGSLELPGWLAFETVASREFRWNGTIYDNTAPAVEFEALYLGSSPEPAMLEDTSKLQADGEVTSFSLQGQTSVQQIGEVAFTTFAVDHTLRPGLHLFRVAAQDPGGLRSTGEYLVFYNQPFYLSIWTYVGLFGLGALGFVGWFGYRRHKRRQLLKRRFNPYIAGAPVLKDNVFYGRERLLSRVMQTIHNNSLLLYGERRIGKTSIQHRLKNRLAELDDPEFKFFPVYIDLQGTPQERFFPTMQEEMFHELEPVLDGLEPITRSSSDVDFGYRNFVRNVQKVLKVLKTKTNKRAKLVLHIDEVDELNYYDPKVNQRLRSLFMKSFAEDLAAVVSGVQIKKEWESEGSPWYNFFEEIQVKAFQRKDAEALIRTPIKGIFKLEPGVVDKIIDQADCKPYLIQKLCIALVNRLHEEQRRNITLADVDAVASATEV